MISEITIRPHAPLWTRLTPCSFAAHAAAHRRLGGASGTDSPASAGKERKDGASDAEVPRHRVVDDDGRGTGLGPRKTVPLARPPGRGLGGAARCSAGALCAGMECMTYWWS
jgi:hypothetical protein